MQVQLITPEKTLYAAEADMVIVPGTEGDFGVLQGHAPFVSTLRPGVITIEAAGGEQRRIAVMAGIAEVVPERCTVLAETALDVGTLSAADAQAMVQDAKADIDAAETDSARAFAEKKLAMAEAITLVL